MAVHLVTFPKWEMISDRVRTVFHTPLSNMVDPPYRCGEYIVCLPVGPIKGRVRVACIRSVQVGQLMQFIGDLGELPEYTSTPELRLTGYDWGEFSSSWKRVYGYSPINPIVMRVEFEYEPPILGLEAVKTLVTVRQLKEKSGLAELLIYARTELAKYETGRPPEELAEW